MEAFDSFIATGRHGAIAGELDRASLMHREDLREALSMEDAEAERRRGSSARSGRTS